MRQEITNHLLEITKDNSYIPISKSRSQNKHYLFQRNHLSHLMFDAFKDSHSPLYLAIHPPLRESRIHFHDYIEMMYVCNGNITHVFENEKVPLSSDEIILLGKNCTHSVAKTGETDIGLNFIISFEMFEAMLSTMRNSSHIKGQAFDKLLQSDGIPYLKFSAKHNMAIQTLMESIIHTTIYDGNTNSFLLEHSISLLLSHIALSIDKNDAPSDMTDDTMKKRLLKYIQTSYTTASLSEAAEMFGVSDSHLSRWINNTFKKSFKELLMQERFSIACELLCTTDMSTDAIIERIGYQERSYFIRQFKKRFGLTPGEYRKKHRQETTAQE